MPIIDLSTKIGGIYMAHPIYNASGARCMTLEELTNLDMSFASALVSKSSTQEKRSGNPEPRYVEDGLGSINSMGLPNEGLAFYLDYAEKRKVDEKPFFISLAGLSLEENLLMLKKTSLSNAIAAVELNLSCPNIVGKPQTGYDFDRSKEVLQKTFEVYKGKLGIKLPPYFDLIHFEKMANIINQFPVSFVTCVNSIGNGLIIDPATESVLIKPKGGFGGIGGDYIKPTALANVRKFYELLRSDIDVVGCGGIKSGTDIFEHILCGASAVQVGTQLMREDVAVFARLLEELKSIMEKKGYNSIADFKGKLKTL